jgi:dolichol-phosphate mannosyltransferase
MNNSNLLQLSVVVPIYFEETIPEFYDRIKKVLVTLEPEISHEVIFVNDGSTDKSLLLLKQLSEKDKTIKVIDLSRNFGHQLAITVGIDNAGGDAVML